MKNTDRLCLGCMREKLDFGVCPYCGFELQKYEASSHHLRPTTILFQKYLIGRVLGEGGFGITYIGWNLDLETAVTIKEYFPSGYVTRDCSAKNEVTVLSGEKEAVYKRGKERFVEEARTLGKLQNIPGIVQVKDLFRENKTAYIVMEYMDGENLSEYLEKKGGKLSSGEVFAMMKPLIFSMEKVHEKGVIHRDISPDNIMIVKDGTVKLIDFGVAKEFSSKKKKMSILLKEGYAPQEQYQEEGKQGPWTDIYALCATMYRAITGEVPVFSVERVVRDTVKWPSDFGIEIEDGREKSLMRGMAVLPEERFQSMQELYQAFYPKEKMRLEKTIPVVRRRKEALEAKFDKVEERKKVRKSKKTAFFLLFFILAGTGLFILMQSPKIAYEMAENYSEKGEEERAVFAYKKAVFWGEKLGVEQYSSQAKKALGDYYYRLEQFEEAMKWYETAESTEEMKKIQREVADQYFEEGEYEKAIQLYEELGEEESVKKGEEAMAESYYQNGKYEEAIKWYKKTGNQVGIQASQRKLGDKFYKEGKFDAAIKWYKAAGEEEKVLDAQQLFAQQCYEEERYQEAKEVYEEILESEQISLSTRLQIMMKIGVCKAHIK